MMEDRLTSRHPFCRLQNTLLRRYDTEGISLITVNLASRRDLDAHGCHPTLRTHSCNCRRSWFPRPGIKLWCAIRLPRFKPPLPVPPVLPPGAKSSSPLPPPPPPPPPLLKKRPCDGPLVVGEEGLLASDFRPKGILNLPELDRILSISCKWRQNADRRMVVDGLTV